MDKILNFFKKPAIATFFTVLSGSLLLLACWIPVAQENFVQENLWKSILITLAYLAGLRIAVQKCSKHLLYLLVILTALVLIFSDYIIIAPGYLAADWKDFLRFLFSFSALFVPSVSVVSAALILLLSKLSRKNKCVYYLKAGAIGVGLGMVAAVLAVITLGYLCNLFGCLD